MHAIPLRIKLPFKTFFLLWLCHCMHVVMCRILKAKKKKELWQAEGSEGRWT